MLAGYLIACLPVVIGATLLTIEKRHKKSFFIALANFLIVLLAIFQTGCRGAYLGFLFFFPVLFIALTYHIKKTIGGFSNLKKRYKNKYLSCS